MHLLVNAVLQDACFLQKTFLIQTHFSSVANSFVISIGFTR